MNHIVLYQPEIPQNTGNIIRTCAATNFVLHLIKPLGFSLDEKHLRRSSVTYYEQVDIRVYENYEEFYEKNQGGKFYFLTRYGKKPHTSFDYSNCNEDIYFIFGRESTGIPKEILSDHLDTCLRLPMTDKVRSLNLSNCVAILSYEALRQQEYQGLLTTEPFKGEDWIIQK